MHIGDVEVQMFVTSAIYVIMGGQFHASALLPQTFLVYKADGFQELFLDAMTRKEFLYLI
jgi:hypothetical protein